MDECLDPSDRQSRSVTVALDYPSAVEGSRLASLTRLSVIQSLRQAGGALDRLFLDSALQGDGEALRLMDAAQAVHRALVALT